MLPWLLSPWIMSSYFWDHTDIPKCVLGFYKNFFLLPAMSRLDTLGAFSDFSFLTTSPCSATRSYKLEEDEELDGGDGEGEAWVGGAIPGLYSCPVSFLNSALRARSCFTATSIWSWYHRHYQLIVAVVSCRKRVNLTRIQMARGHEQ